MMKKTILSLLLLLSVSLPVTAQTNENDFTYMLDAVKHMREIILQQKNEKAAQIILSQIKNAKPLLIDDQYKGHQIVHGLEIKGFIGISYKQNKAEIAVFTTPPLRVRHATKAFKTYRKLLQEQYKEIKHNKFYLGNDVVAQLKKKARKVSIDVYRNK